MEVCLYLAPLPKSRIYRLMHKYNVLFYSISLQRPLAILLCLHLRNRMSRLNPTPRPDLGVSNEKASAKKHTLEVEDKNIKIDHEQ